MHRLNFNISGNFIELEAEGVLWKMHQQSRYVGLDYRVDHTAKVLFTYNQVDPQSGETILSQDVALVFSGVFYFEVTSRDPSVPFDEDKTVETIFYVQTSDKTEDYLSTISGFVPTSTDCDRDYHMMIRMWGGQLIRIGAETAAFALQVK